jgi:hypothetical protein
VSWQAKAWADEVIRRAGSLGLLRGKAGQPRIDFLRNLADRHNTSQEPFPKVATIARDTGHSERSMQRASRFWARLGAQTPVHRGGHQSSVYWLHLDWLPAEAIVTPGRPKSSPLRPPIVTPEAPNRHPSYEPRDLTQKGEASESARARLPAPASQGGDKILLVKEGKAASPPAAKRTRKTPLPDDWAPPPEVRQIAIAAGFDPDDLMEDMALWCRHNAVVSADWTCFARRWIKGEKKRRPRLTFAERGENKARACLQRAAELMGGLAATQTGRTVL